MHDVGNKTEPRILRSWKEIASYVGYGVRTVQCYERQFGLPARRPGARSRSSVIALADEVDAWLRQAYVLRHRKPENRRLCPFCSGTGLATSVQRAGATSQSAEYRAEPDSVAMS